MKQFGKILKFELRNYLTNKIFVGVTLFLVLAIMVVMFFPRITQGSHSDEPAPDTSSIQETPEPGTPSDAPVILIAGDITKNKNLLKDAFTSAFSEYQVKLSEDSVAQIKEKITSGEVECAFVMDSPTSYTYYVNNLSMIDDKTAIADTLLQNVYQMSAMLSGGMAIEDAQKVISVHIENKTESLGKDQIQNFFYTYIMIFALYMVIIMYGQMVAMNVATEKSSRAMELLITSAKPVSMMFGKVIASCIAGLIQLVAVFGSSLLCFNLNKEYWADNLVIASIFDMPVDLFVYMLIFFTLGFFIYAFLYGAIGSTASKLEDINTSVMPITLVFVIAFIIVIFSMSSGNVDSLLMKICSFVPFTSPMAMFTRVAMGSVPFYEIAISIVILICSVVGIGVISAKIYRVGVLLYGTTPKLGSILKAIKKS